MIGVLRMLTKSTDWQAGEKTRKARKDSLQMRALTQT